MLCFFFLLFKFVCVCVLSVGLFCFYVNSVLFAVLQSSVFFLLTPFGIAVTCPFFVNTD